jgi:hypothetical protein
MKSTDFDVEAAVKFAYDDLAASVRNGDFKGSAPFRWLYASVSTDGTVVGDYDETRLSLAAQEAVERLSDEEMPGYLRQYICSVLLEVSRGRRPLRKRGHPSKFVRDLTLSVATQRVQDKFGLKLTRGDATRDHKHAESACSIIQKALERHRIFVGERTIEELVKQARRRTLEEVRAIFSRLNRPVQT